MKTKILLSAAAVLTSSLLAAYADPKGDVTNAAQKLSGEDNYSWTTTVVVPPDSRFKPGPTNGKTQKDGLTYLKLSMRDNTIEMLMQGSSVAVKDPDPDGGWESLADYQSNDNQGPGRFLGMMTKNFRATGGASALTWWVKYQTCRKPTVLTPET